MKNKIHERLRLMNPLAVTRILTSCTCKVQRKLIRFAWNGHRAIRAFERRRKRGLPFFPAFLMLSVTNRCHLRCKGCWVGQTREPQQLSLAQMHGIVSTAQKYGSRFFGILGGEPLLHPNLLQLFAEHPGAYFQLFTNGLALTGEVASQLAKTGNVTPLISIEGLENETRLRRGGDDVFARSLAGLEASVRAGLFTGVAASINQRNFDELVSVDYLNFLVKKGVHYLWYYIYRPCGSEPDFDCALDEERILALRRFIVEQRRKARILIIDAYWDGRGNAVCPGAMGLSHHIAPNGGVEFCPIVQFSGDFLNDDASNLEAILQQNPLLEKLRTFTSGIGRNCVLMESPNELAAFLQEHHALDSSNRDAFAELQTRSPMICHDLKGREIPEQSLAYRLGKTFYFFGFGAYG
ncbi:MAG: radical SAM protein [Planctomycetaceae bacterium]|nr:radical SAM protein [Planctomycetaceae bacterium]